MADVRRSQAAADGTVFGYLGVRIRGSDVWTAERRAPSRRLGPVAGATAGAIEPRRSALRNVLSRLLGLGDVPPQNVTIFVAFADGTRYERLVLPWVRDDYPKIAGEIGRFNAAAYVASPSRDHQPDRGPA
jgi:hypothetical protein